jgi:DNA-binding Lrp family transcriptional regulator
MAKSSKKQIYEDDLKVVAELQKSAKENIDVISKNCGFSRQKTWRIIKRLEEDKTIWGYNAVVNEEKQGLKRYMILIKRTTLPIDKKLVDKIITRQLENSASKIGIKIESSMFTHGTFDWVIYFKAKDMIHAKKFSEIINKTYWGYIGEVHMLEALFPIRRQGILNPEIQKLKEFL